MGSGRMGREEAMGFLVADPPVLEFFVRRPEADYLYGRSATVAAVIGLRYDGVRGEPQKPGTAADDRLTGRAFRPVPYRRGGDGVAGYEYLVEADSVVVYLPTGGRWEGTEGGGPYDPTQPNLAAWRGQKD